MSGILYLCATPIGNLEDMTYRAVRVLREADCIAAEDTRHTRLLLNHFAIHKPLVSYHEHNKAAAGPQLIARLEAGEDIVLVSDAGLPGISDPGADLTALAIAAGITIVPVPGANAALTALVASGLDTKLFTFIGFLPHQNKERQALLAEITDSRATLIFYEAPHRLRATLAVLLAALGDRQAVAGRELTKKFEEFVRGTLTELAAHFTATEPRGEFTLLVAGLPAGAAAYVAEAGQKIDAAAAVAELVASGINKKEAMRQVAKRYNLSRRQVYSLCLNSNEKKEA